MAIKHRGWLVSVFTTRRQKHAEMDANEGLSPFIENYFSIYNFEESESLFSTVQSNNLFHKTIGRSDLCKSMQEESYLKKYKKDVAVECMLCVVLVKTYATESITYSL